jgi:hypothetical protein
MAVLNVKADRIDVCDCIDFPLHDQSLIVSNRRFWVPRAVSPNPSRLRRQENDRRRRIRANTVGLRPYLHPVLHERTEPQNFVSW